MGVQGLNEKSLPEPRLSRNVPYVIETKFKFGFDHYFYRRRTLGSMFSET